MKWPWSKAPDLLPLVNRAETKRAAEVTAKAAVLVEAQSIEGKEAKQQLQARLESNHFRDKVELALFGRELR